MLTRRLQKLEPTKQKLEPTAQKRKLFSSPLALSRTQQRVSPSKLPQYPHMIEPCSMQFAPESTNRPILRSYLSLVPLQLPSDAVARTGKS